MVGWLGRVALVLLLAGCAGVSSVPGGGGGAQSKVTGTVGYPQRIALPPGAVVKVQLVDISRADAPALLVGEQTLTAGGKQPPIAFAIPYDPAKIDARYTYAVTARIYDEGNRLIFINDRRYAVLTRGAPTHVDMILRAVGRGTPR